MQANQYIEDYQICCLAGDGGQANVYLCRKNNKNFAVKVYFPKNNIQLVYYQEVEFLSALKFNHIVNFIEGKLEAKMKLKDEGQKVVPMIVMEFAEHGELFNLVHQAGSLREDICRALFKQLIAAIKYLHEQGVAHRDIKHENILLDQKFNLKLGDFGLATSSKGFNQDFKLHSNVGTTRYKAPEIYQGTYNGLKVDMFAAGVVLFLMYSKMLPFNSTIKSDTQYNLIRQKKYEKFWKGYQKYRPANFFSTPFKRLLNSFFSDDPEKRPTFEELEDDEWMKGPTANQNELFQYMSEQYKKMQEKDPVLQQMNKKKRDELVHRAQSNEGTGNRKEFQYFIKEYNEINIKTEALPLSQRSGAIYLKQKPEFIIVWIKNYIKQKVESNHRFIEEVFVEQKPHNYSVSVEGNNIIISLIFEIIGEDKQCELVVKGSLIKRPSSEEVGVYFEGVKGHVWWTMSLILELKADLKTLL